MPLVSFNSPAEHVGEITLNDPDHLNAMSEAMAAEMKALVSTLRGAKDRKRAIILTGAGRAFSAGGDLQMLEKKRELSEKENHKRMLEFYESFLSLRSLEIPLIAVINGHAIGAGLCVACGCDIRIASKNAKLGFTFTRLGLHPGMGATYFIPRIVGIGAASELLLTGRVIESARALELGLVTELHDTDKIVARAREIAHEIALCGPLATRQLLNSLREPGATLSAALDREAQYQSENYADAEFAEGVRAAIEKREAKFIAAK